MHFPDYVSGSKIYLKSSQDGPKKFKSSQEENRAHNLLFFDQLSFFSPNTKLNMVIDFFWKYPNKSKFVEYLDCLDAPAFNMSTIKYS